MFNKGEEMKVCVPYHNYLVFENGQVWSKFRKRFLKPYITEGYQQCSLYINKKETRPLVHRLVYELFLGDIPSDLTVDHIVEDKNLNHYWNLQLLPRGENARKSNLGVKKPNCGQKGSKHHQSKLTEEDISEIRRLLNEGNLLQKEIAEMFGVHVDTISSIKLGKTWSHIK